MKESMRVDVDGQELELELKQFTLITASPDIQDVKVIDDDVASISIFETIAATDKLSKDTWDDLRQAPEFLAWFNGIFDFAPPADIQMSGTGVKHIVGMFLCIAEALGANKVPNLKFPETALHPQAQARLASTLVKLQTGTLFE